MNKMFYLTSNITADIYLQVIEKDILNSPEIEIFFFKGNKNCSKIELWTKFRFLFKNKIFFIPPSIPESCECKFTFPMPQNSYLFPRWKNIGRNVEPCPDVAQTKLFAPWQVIWSYDRALADTQNCDSKSVRRLKMDGWDSFLACCFSLTGPLQRWL